MRSRTAFSRSSVLLCALCASLAACSPADPTPDAGQSQPVDAGTSTPPDAGPTGGPIDEAASASSTITVQTGEAAVHITAADASAVTAPSGAYASVNGDTVTIGAAPDQAGETLELTVPAGATVQITTTSGAVEVDGHTGDLRVTTSTGNVVLRPGDIADGASHTTTSESGNIELRVLDTVNAQLTATAPGGAVRIDAAEVEFDGQTGAGTAAGSLGDGSDACSITLETTSGDIDITAQ